MKALRAFNEGIAKIEGWIVVAMVLAMILLSFVQVVLRNFFDSGLTWGDITLRNMVLWIGFIGASMATKQDRHISIDALTKFLNPTWKAASDVLTSLFSFCVSIVFIWASTRFVLSEFRAGDIAFLIVPFWMLQLIIPIGFSLIAMRFFIKVVEDVAYLTAHVNGNGGRGE